MSRQIGKVRISADLVNNRDKRVMELFRAIDFFPIDIDYYQNYDEVTYTGLSHHFQPLSIGEEIPYYKIILEQAKVEQEGKI